MIDVAVLLVSCALTVLALLALLRWADGSYPSSGRAARLRAYEVELYGDVVSPSLYDT